MKVFFLLKKEIKRFFESYDFTGTVILSAPLVLDQHRYTIHIHHDGSAFFGRQV